MIYPQLTDIIAAAKIPQFIKDPFFSGKQIRLLASGRPDMFAGGFSQVFAIDKGGEKWAFKVWVTDIPDNKKRYAAIKEYLNEVSLPYFSEFEYVEGGLFVDGYSLDTFRMRWIDGISLAHYISKYLDNENLLKRLAENFLIMTEELHHNKISHGDLQHENIFITDDGNIKLIDYDSICVPSMEGSRDITRGKAGYQHPSRLSAGYLASTKIDYFSELVIYISILAVAERPLLWEKYTVMRAEYRLLFSYNDFLNFEESSIRKDLIVMSQKIQDLVFTLDSYLAAHLNLQPFV